MSKLIEKEGKFYKECGVVMLEITGLDRNLGKLFKTIIDGLCQNNYGKGIEFKDCNYYHIFITCDDKIEHGNWMINLNGDTILKYDSKNEGDGSWREFWRKIIATTDKLCIGHEDDYDERSKTGGNPIWLPQSSDKFIQAYIDAYNKGEKIEKVLVEYEKGNFRPDGSQGYFEPGAFTFEWLLKLKDNNIIIKKMKDNWTREEVETSHLSMAVDIAKHILQGNSFTTFNPEEWIKQNL